MKIKVLKDSRCAYKDPSRKQIVLKAGDVVDVEHEIATSMLDSGKAEKFEEKKIEKSEAKESSAKKKTKKKKGSDE